MRSGRLEARKQVLAVSGGVLEGGGKNCANCPGILNMEVDVDSIS